MTSAAESFDGYPNAPGVDDPQRLATVRLLEILDTPAEAAYDRIVQLATRLLGAPTGLVSVVDDRRQFFKSAFGLADPWATLRETPLSHSYCQYTLQKAGPLIINDARQDPLFSKSGALTELGCIAYAGVPLIVEGAALGALCVIDTEPRDWSPDEIETLELLAASVMTEIQLRHELNRRNEIERIKDEFMSVVGHELRTPLTSIRASLAILASGKVGTLPDSAHRMFDIAVRNTDRLLRLLNDVIDVERLTTGRIELHIETARAGDLLERAGEAMQGLAEQAGVTLDIGKCDAVINVDNDRIAQALTNLLSNAIKFSPSGSAVFLTAERMSDHILFEVRDQGRGIPADKIEAIFDRFQQVESGDARLKGGAGLGLAIVRGIVEQHGGTVTASSDGVSGSTFSIRLPV